ncbi:hypothetical protein D3C71_1937510 [compost metagenome]
MAGEPDGLHCERHPAVLVGQHHAQPTSADADASDLPHRAVFEPGWQAGRQRQFVGSPDRLLAGHPGRHPLRGGHGGGGGDPARQGNHAKQRVGRHQKILVKVGTA